MFTVIVIPAGAGTSLADVPALVAGSARTRVAVTA
ncbi:hypothetical protein GALL_317000 [mine drainage metagenome]|uniref:Uncharacterized protein n=1 Tax=mine drainage metagenome TaxID=410659 RepID=A0A1J5RE56_9ZZZZ